MIDPRKIGQFLMGQWETTKQPLKERASVLPFGQYEDGSVGLAWPGMLADPLQRGYEAANTPIPAINDDQAWADKSAAMFDVTSLAPMGAGLAGGIVDNAVGSAGGRLKQPQGIRAYHGSPHDFDKFDLSKIGTGEGAQAYGHGLYFADSEDVARSYRDALSPKLKIDGQVMSHGLDAADAAENAAKQIGAPEEVQNTLRWYINRGYSADEALNDISKTAPEWHDKIKQVLQPSDYKGRMYEVNIKANPEDFLDWDQGGEALYRSKINEVENSRDVLKSKYGEEALFASPTELARRELIEQGIPGIRYLDGMSRDGGAGTSNYVVFDEQLIDILRKYANAPTGSIPSLAAQTQDGEGNPALLEYLKAIGLY